MPAPRSPTAQHPSTSHMHNYVAPLITSICCDCSARNVHQRIQTNAHHGSNAHHSGGAAGRSSQEVNHGRAHPRHETTRRLHEKHLSGLVSFPSERWPRQLYFWKVACPCWVVLILYPRPGGTVASVPYCQRGSQTSANGPTVHWRAGVDRRGLGRFWSDRWSVSERVGSLCGRVGAEGLEKKVAGG